MCIALQTRTDEAVFAQASGTRPPCHGVQTHGLVQGDSRGFEKTANEEIDFVKGLFDKKDDVDVDEDEKDSQE